MGSEKKQSIQFNSVYVAARYGGILGCWHRIRKILTQPISRMIRE